MISMNTTLGTLILYGTLFVTALFGIALSMPSQLSGQTATVTLAVEKKFSGPEEGFTVEQFSFEISGNGILETVPHNGTLELPAGTYTITEIGPNEFDHDLWRIQWSGACSNDNNDDTNATIVVEENDTDGRTISCRADNQFRPEDAESDDRTVELVLEKKFSGDAKGYTESQFPFKISGGSVQQTVPHGGSVQIGIGTYTVEEIGPVGFIHDNWETQWSGDVCEDGDNDDADADIVIDASDLNKNQVYCRADNRFDSENGNGGGGNGGGNATLVVTKVVVGTSTAPSAFTFTITNGTSTSLTESFETDGSNEFTLATGTYSVVEVGTTTGYTVTYENCTDIALAAGDSKTCTITNTFNTDNGNGGGNGGGGDDNDDDDNNGNGGGDSSSSSSSSRGGSSNDPAGRVAGAQTEVIPAGSPNTGAGGMAPTPRVALTFLILSLIGGIFGFLLLRFA